MHRPVEIIPAILSTSYEDITRKVAAVSEVAPWIQLDIVDGEYGTQKTWPFLSLADKDLAALVHEEATLPQWEDVSFEFDLMVKNPRALADTFVTAGASRIIVHYGSFVDNNEREVFLREFKNKYNMPEPLTVELGLAVGFETPIEDIQKYIEYLDCIEIMGIKDVGAQGEPFAQGTIEKVRKCRELFPEMVISVDGGVREEYVEPLIEAGVNRLVIGSAIWSSSDPEGEYEHLKNLVS